MIDALKVSGVSRVHVDLGNPAIYRALAADLGVDAETSEALFHAVQQKNAVDAKQLAVLTGLHGGIETLERARRELPARPAITQALAQLERLARSVEGPGVEISVDLSELGGFNYESGLVFAAFAEGSPDAMARGGRYDEVGASFGRARPATGFTLDLRQLAALAPGPARRGAILAPCGDDAALRTEIERLRSAGEIVVVDLPGHTDSTNELGCDRKLEKKDGKWRVT
jgi:ATP phosphoribosyltransferase regulatory subunit